MAQPISTLYKFLKLWPEKMKERTIINDGWIMDEYIQKIMPSQWTLVNKNPA